MQYFSTFAKPLQIDQAQFLYSGRIKLVYRSYFYEILMTFFSPLIAYLFSLLFTQELLQ